MKAAVVQRYGGPQVLAIREVTDPVPADGQAIVRVRAIGLNFADILGRWGVYPGTPSPPFVPGIEFSGEVVKPSPSGNLFRPGDRVMGYSRLGSHAEFVSVDERMIAPIPASSSFETAAAFPVASLTAYHGLVTLAHVQSGEKLLVHAAAGGVGTATLQLARHLGVETFATAGNDEKLRVARESGADHLFNYRSGDFAPFVREQSGGYGVDVVMDSVGGTLFRNGWNLLAGMGRYILYGLSSVSGSGKLSRVKALRVFGAMGFLLPSSLISANRSIFGFNLGTLIGKEEYLNRAGKEILSLFSRDVFRPVVGKVFPFGEIVEAHRFLQTGKSVGKVVVTLDDGATDAA